MRRTVGPLLLLVAAATTGMALTGAPVVRWVVVALVTAAIIAVAWIHGAPFVTIPPVRERPAPDRHAAALLLGIPVVALVVGLLTATHALRPGPVALALTVTGVLAVWLRLRRRDREGDAHVAARPEGRPGLVPRGYVWVPAALAAAYVGAMAVAPIVDADSLVYHIALPRWFVRAGGLDIPAGVSHAAFVEMVHMLHTLAVLAGAATASVGVMGVLAAVFLWVVWRAASETVAGTAPFAVSALLGTTILLFGAGTPRVDLPLALYLLVAQALILLAIRERSPGWLLWAGAFGGLALSTKHTAALYGAALVPLVAAGAVTGAYRLRTIVGAAGVALLVASPWLVRNAVLFGDPLYPALAGLSAPDWVTRLAGRELEVRTIHALAREPVTLVGMIFHPGRLSPEVEARFYLWSPLYLLVPLALLTRDRRVWGWALPAVVYVAALRILAPETNLRYYIPALAPLALAAAARLGPWLARLRSGRPRLAGVAARLAVVAGVAPLFVMAPPGLLAARYRVAVASGAVEDPDSDVFQRIRLKEAVAAHVPPGDTALILFDGRGLDLPRDMIHDPHSANWLYLRNSGLTRGCMPMEGPDLVLVNWEHQETLAGHRFPPPFHYDDVPAWAERCLIPLWRGGRYGLYTIRRDAPESPGAVDDGAGKM